MFPAHIFLRCPHYLNAWNNLALKAFAVVLCRRWDFEKAHVEEGGGVLLTWAV